MKISNSVPLVAHVIPYDGPGGAETAARSVCDGDYKYFAFRKVYFFDSSKGLPSRQKIKRRLNNPLSYLSVLFRLNRLKPRLIIGSLWRGCVVLIVYKMLHPTVKAVTFLHLPCDTHWIDSVVNKLSMVLSDEIWADSHATLNDRVPPRLRNRARVISFQIRNTMLRDALPPKPKFIFWGRLNPQKNLPRALKIFSEIKKREPNAEYLIIGPDDGEREMLTIMVRSLGLVESVNFLGPLDQDKIFEIAKEYSFYLQTSITEGMALSVVEAMQSGLVPIVTSVGGIASYCIDSVNSICVDRNEEVCERVLDLLTNPLKYKDFTIAAASTWSEGNLYRDDVIKACRDILTST